jgi:hypothetical protein
LVSATPCVWLTSHLETHKTTTNGNNLPKASHNNLPKANHSNLPKANHSNLPKATHNSNEGKGNLRGADNRRGRHAVDRRMMTMD